MTAPIPRASFRDFEPGRLWSLWDMINCQLMALVGFVSHLGQELHLAADKARIADAIATSPSYDAKQIPRANYTLTESDRNRVENMLQVASRVAQQFDLIRTADRIHHLRIGLRIEPENADSLRNQLQVLRDALHDDMPFKRFYFYEDAKAAVLLRVVHDWAVAFQKFPSVKGDAEAASDCYALMRNDACVFHCMRVLENGLKVLARSVDLTFDVQQWGTIINDIEGKIKAMQNNGIPGMGKAEKDARLQFLSEAAKEFSYFKDGWRNYVSHGRGDYDDGRTKSVLEHVRAFMNHLASELSEGPPA